MPPRPPPDTPVATYRLQLSRDFTFDAAAAVVPYLAELGISHLYASPFLKARAGSAHGYDIVDHNQLNPELGGRASFDALCARLREHGMGLILDFVPNHMGIGRDDNPWWLDILEWGAASPYAGYFDIDWNPPRPALAGKVLVPVLGQNYGSALANGEIELRFDPATGCLSFWHYDHRFPLAPMDYPEVLQAALPDLPGEHRERLAAALAGLRAAAGAPPERAREAAEAAKRSLRELAESESTAARLGDAAAAWRGIPGDAASFARLHELLQRQAFRPAYWRVAADEINYRRFFDVSDLAGLRMEETAVFAATHGLVGELIAAGQIHGLRIDHVDGLADPEEYCRVLAAFTAARLAPERNGEAQTPYILVEKILAYHEQLRPAWPVAGTTGYDYLALANGLFVEAAGLERLERIWRGFTDIDAPLADETYRCKRTVIDNILTSELAVLTNLLVQITEADWFSRDFTRQRLRAALAEIAAAFPVYRTYVTARGRDEADIRDIVWAVEQAKKRWTGTDVEVLDFIRSVLTLEIAETRPAHYQASQAGMLRFIARFQQYTSAVTAKAVEDTLFYRHIPLLSLNEVGADPRHPGTSLEAFHREGPLRARNLPRAMLASETHDTKRAEDVRARLNVLSELPEEWARRIARWHELNRFSFVETEDGIAPAPNDEYLIYQTIVGSWPLEITSVAMAERWLGAYLERLKAYVVKAMREAKATTSWTLPNERYENAVLAFIDRILGIASANPFLESVIRFMARIAPLGAINGLAQLVLKATMPGVPDFYQGSELWDFSLVDPDNRRPADFERRRLGLLHVRSATVAAMKGRWRDGLLKLHVAAALLRLRGQLPKLFRDGGYQRLTVEGPGQENVVAFSRHLGETEIVVVAARLVARRLAGERGVLWPNGDIFAGTVLRGPGTRQFVDVLSGTVLTTPEEGMPLDLVLRLLPVAVLSALPPAPQ